MTSFSPQNDAALSQVVAMPFGAISIALPTGTIYLLEGAGETQFGGQTWRGDDATFGSILSLEAISDGTGDDALSLTLTLAPKDDAAAVELAQPSMQGAEVMIYLGAIDPATGLPITTPELIVAGSFDSATLKGAANSRTLECEITSDDELFFTTDDGVRLSDTFHRLLWPGETGLADVTGIERHIYWGTAPVSGVSA